MAVDSRNEPRPAVLQAHLRENWAWGWPSLQNPPRSVSALVSSYDPDMHGSRPLSSALCKGDG